MPSASVILAFYNDLPILRLVLDALAKQFHGQFEVLIADDGSRPDVVTELKRLLPQYPFKASHLWHEDQGFRKTVILNRAVTHAQFDCLIFVDADCVPQGHFVDDHLRAARAGICQAGRRVDMFRDALALTQCRDASKIIQRNWLKLLWCSVTGRARNVERGLRLPPVLAQRFSGRPSSIVGCNFSVNRYDLIAINGFDERNPVPWGAEDSDINRRLLGAGVNVVGLRYQATMVHLDASFMKRNNPGPDDDRLAFFLSVRDENRVWTPYGIVKEDRPDPRLYP